VLTADAPSNRVTVIAEEEAPTGGAAAAAALALEAPVDAPAPVAETEEPILISQEFQDPAYLTQTEDENNFEDENKFEEALEPVSEIVSINGRPYIDSDESPLQYLPSHSSTEYRADRQLFSSVISDKATPTNRLMWLGALILLAGVGLLWATGVLPFQGAPAEAVISGEVAEPRPDDGGEAKTETLIPLPEQVAADPAKEIPSRPAASSPAADSDSAGSKIPIAAAQTDASVEAPSAAPLPPKRSEIVPPDLSHLSVDPVSESAPSAELHGDGRGDLQAQEPLPSPERPAGEERPAPTIIRKSGDVLQNTATMRPRPIYPTAARSDNIKGQVTVEVTIDEEGSVITAKPISGPEQLRSAAVTAARGWKWTPTRVGRKRAKVVGTITFQFKD
jgi:TonB family protein